MPKSRESGRGTPKDDAGVEGAEKGPGKPLPDLSDVERAIRRIVEKLRPKQRNEKPKR